MTVSLSRRSLLAASGASALLWPLLHLDRGRAQDSAFPKRVVFVISGNGTIEEAFWPSGTAGHLTLNPISAPLEAHKGQLLFVKGVDLKVWAEDNPFGGNGDSHHAWCSVLTATVPATGDPPHDPGGPGLALASSASIDQVIGRALGMKRPLPFPVLSVRAWGGDGNGSQTLSWTGDRAPFSAENEPHKLFDSLFSGVVSGPDPELVRLRKTRRSVLDYLGKAIERQQKRLGTDDRHKLGLHLEAVRNIERQLAGGQVTATCEPPTVSDLDFRAMENMPALLSVEMDLMVAAMACGLTQVCTLAIGDNNDYDVFYPWLGIERAGGIEFPERHHHDISHRPGESNRDKIDVEKWYLGQVALLLDKLAAVPEGDGTLLDNTVVLYMNSMNSGFSHTVFNVPVVVAGGKNLGVRTGGRVLDLGGAPHNPLLAALANAVGVPLESFGDARYPGSLDLG